MGKQRFVKRSRCVFILTERDLWQGSPNVLQGEPDWVRGKRVVGAKVL